MKKFRELMEKAGDTAVFTFGRFNPPTTGHEKLIEAVANQWTKNSGSKMYIYASQSNDPKKNPLPYTKKIAYMRKMFKKYAKNITTGKPRTAIEVAVELHDKGHKAIVMVVGSDRVVEFNKILNNYNGVEGKRHGYYGFDNIEVVSAGERDPDAEGVAGMSASKMRAAAEDGDFQSFEMGLPSSFAQRKELYRDVRKGMGMREEREMGDMTDREYLRDLYLTGKIWNAGDIIEAKGVTGSIVRKGTNYVSFADDDGKVHKCWIHEIVLNERNYAKEYANYQGTPEQIVRRSSRNKARRVMGDKTKIGMDVGHKDNDPMNNDPSNLRNEVPSDNRREPRLRKNPAKIKGKVYKPGDKPPPGGWPKMTFGTKRMPKKEEAELDEMAWYHELIAKISQMKHPTGYERMAKAYAAKMKEKEYKGKPGLAISDIARMTKNIGPRQLATYINKLVDKGIFPKELKAEYEIQSFKSFVETLNKNADQGDYIDDFKDSDAPQFKGKSKKKRVAMAVAAYKNK